MTCFSDFVTPIRSGDIRDQIRKLSKIAPNFERFLLCQILYIQPYSPKW